jgi:hypothetical protein
LVAQEQVADRQALAERLHQLLVDQFLIHQQAVAVVLLALVALVSVAVLLAVQVMQQARSVQVILLQPHLHKETMAVKAQVVEVHLHTVVAVVVARQR